MNVFAPVAVFGFWVLLVAGWLLDELGAKSAAVFILLWLAGFAGFTWLRHPTLFISYAAVLDIALVLVVFKGDVTLK